MALTALEIKDKQFGVKFRGYDASEVEEFLDIVYRDYEDLVRQNHELEVKISGMVERLNYFERNEGFIEPVCINRSGYS